MAQIRRATDKIDDTSDLDPNITRDDVVAFARQLANEYGLTVHF